MESDQLLRATCPECGVGIGEPHELLCNVAPCLATGLVRLGCREGVSGSWAHNCGSAVWEGDWPGHRECREFGWHVRWDAEAGGWVRCSADEPGSGPDLSRLYDQALWDVDRQRWVQRRTVLFSRSARSGRASLHELARMLRRWCDAAGYAVVAEHIGTAAGWRAALAEVAAGRAELIAVPSIERLGHGRQVFTRVAEVRKAGGSIVGPGVRLAGTGLIRGC